MPTNQKTTSNKRQREQDQKERAAERIARRTERKARAAARLASGQVGPQIAEPAPPERDVVPHDPAASTIASWPLSHNGLVNASSLRPLRIGFHMPAVTRNGLWNGTPRRFISAPIGPSM